MEAAAAAWREVVSAAAEAVSIVPAVSHPPSPAEGGLTTPAVDPPPIAPPERVHPPHVAVAATAAQDVPPSDPSPVAPAGAAIEVNSVDPEVPPAEATHSSTQPPQQRHVRATWRNPQLHD